MLKKIKILRFFYLLLILGLFISGLNHVRLHFIDYPVYEEASLFIIKGKPLDIYDVSRKIPGGFYYSYFFALMFSPFALLGKTFGKILFFLLFFLSYLKLLTFSIKKSLSFIGTTGENTKYAISIISIILSSYALNDAFMNANIGILLLAMCIICYEKSESSSFFSGLMLGAAVAFKIYSVLILCYFIWLKHYKIVFWSLFFTAFFYLCPIFIYGFNTGIILLKNQYYVVSHFNEHWGFDSLVFQNIPATSMRILKLFGIDARIAFHFSIILSLILVLLIYIKSFFMGRNLNIYFKDLMFFLSLALIPLLVPVCWYNMHLFYLPMISYLVGQALIKDKKVVLVLLIYFVLFCLTTPDIIGRKLNDKLEFYAIPFWGVFIMVIFYIVRLVKKYPEYFLHLKMLK